MRSVGIPRIGGPPSQMASILPLGLKASPRIPSPLGGVKVAVTFRARNRRVQLPEQVSSDERPASRCYRYAG
jgi:hypothetical protein